MADNIIDKISIENSSGNNIFEINNTGITYSKKTDNISFLDSVPEDILESVGGGNQNKVYSGKGLLNIGAPGCFITGNYPSPGEGKWLQEIKKALLIVGCGTSDETRENAMFITSEGKIYILNKSNTSLDDKYKELMRNFNTVNYSTPVYPEGIKIKVLEDSETDRLFKADTNNWEKVAEGDINISGGENKRYIEYLRRNKN